MNQTKIKFSYKPNIVLLFLMVLYAGFVHAETVTQTVVIKAANDTEYGIDQIATMHSETVTAPDGFTTYRVSIDVSPKEGMSVCSVGAGQAWGINSNDGAQSININPGENAEIGNIDVDFDYTDGGLSALNIVSAKFHSIVPRAWNLEGEIARVIANDTSMSFEYPTSPFIMEASDFNNEDVTSFILANGSGKWRVDSIIVEVTFNISITTSGIIVLMPNGGQGEILTLPFSTLGEAITLPTNTFTHDEKYFAGWADNTGQFVCDDGGDFTPLLVNDTLYAIWKDYGPGKVYYVSPLGDNKNDGLSEEKPFRVVQYALDNMTVNDTLIVLDGLYTGWLDLKSGITIKAKNPRQAVFSGAETIDSLFEQHTEHIYKVKVDTTIKQVFFNDQPMIWAQWPNMQWQDNWTKDKKWVYSGEESDKGVFTCDEFNEIENLDLVGGYCFLRYGKGNSCYSRLVESFDGTKLYWNTDNFFSAQYAGEDGYKGTAPNSEFFIAGTYDLLDAPGEWVVSNDTLYIYPPEGKDPNNFTVLIKTTDYALINTSPLKDVKIDGIDFLATSVNLNHCTNVSFNDSYFTYIGTELIWKDRVSAMEENHKPISVEGDEISFENCLFAGAQNSAMELTGANLKVNNCVFFENNRNSNRLSNVIRLHANGTYKITNNTFFNNGNSVFRLYMEDDYLESSEPEIAYNHIFNAGMYNSDVEGVRMGLLSQKDVQVHHNWIHNVNGSSFRLDVRGLALSLHHNVFWSSKRGINIEGYEQFNIYNNTSHLHNASDCLMKHFTDQKGIYEDVVVDLTFPPIDDWNVLNNMVADFIDAIGPTEKDEYKEQKALGNVHPDRIQNSDIPITDRGAIQKNLTGDIDGYFKSTRLSTLDLRPKDNSVNGGAVSTAELEAQGVNALGTYRGAYAPGEDYWSPGSNWMPVGLSVISTMAEAEAFAGEYRFTSIVPEFYFNNLAIGVLQDTASVDSVKYFKVLAPPRIVSSSINTAKVNNEYIYNIKTNGVGTLSFEGSPDADWLIMDGDILKGIPSDSDANTNVDVVLIYANETDTVIQAFTITVIPDIPLAITSTPVLVAGVGQSYTYSIATTGTGFLSFDNQIGDDWIEWLNLKGNVLSGTPTEADMGSYEVVITFENELELISQVYTLTVGTPLITYTLNVTTENGTVAVIPEKEKYNEGDTVMLIPYADSGYEFGEWKDIPTGTIQQGDTITLVINDNLNITAFFETLSVVQGVDNLKCNVFPNPSDGNFIVKLSVEDICDYSITSLSGKSIKQGRGQNSFNINLSHCQSGIYLLSVRLKDKVMVSKLLIE